jgi:hypothetical protein
MTKDERMGLWASCDSRRGLLGLALGALLLAGCSAGSSAAKAPPPGQEDAGHGSRGTSDGSGPGAAVSDASEDLATDAGGGSEDAHAGSPTAADADGGVDAGEKITCIAHGAHCGLTAGSELCCTDGCVNGVCGCLSEGSQVITSSDAGGGACCDGLAEVDGGYCGTSACVPDGTPCQTDAGVVCCNDNCNGSTCGGL